MAGESTQKRVAAFTIAIARALGSSVQEIRSMARGAYLHDCDSIPLADAAEIVAAQHESYDGTGFPKSL
jgi:HD-GYP domain-containing protein (c-di-GMP phosphodiesterase class II)